MTGLEEVFDKYKWVSVARTRNGKSYKVSIFIDNPHGNYEEVEGQGQSVKEALKIAEAKLTRAQLNIIYVQFLEMHKDD